MNINIQYKTWMSVLKPPCCLWFVIGPRQSTISCCFSCSRSQTISPLAWLVPLAPSWQYHQHLLLLLSTPDWVPYRSVRFVLEPFGLTWCSALGCDHDLGFGHLLSQLYPRKAWRCWIHGFIWLSDSDLLLGRHANWESNLFVLLALMEITCVIDSEKVMDWSLGEYAKPLCLQVKFGRDPYRQVWNDVPRTVMAASTDA